MIELANMHLVTGYAGQAHVKAADQASLHAALFGSESFVLDRGNKLSASVITNNSIRIADGDIIMQGRHVRLEEGSTVELAIENGAQGYYRNDLIVARYTKNADTGIEEVNLVVIKGTAVASNPADPEYIHGDIINDHVIQADFPLYRVPLDGINVQELVCLFSVFGSIEGAYDSAKNAQTTANEAKNVANSKAVKQSYFATLNASGWSSSAPYTQTVAVSGILATDTPVIDLDMAGATADTAADIQAAWACVGRIVTGSNEITAYCYEEAPTANLPLNILVVR